MATRTGTGGWAEVVELRGVVGEVFILIGSDSKFRGTVLCRKLIG